MKKVKQSLVDWFLGSPAKSHQIGPRQQTNQVGMLKGVFRKDSRIELFHGPIRVDESAESARRYVLAENVNEKRIEIRTESLEEAELAQDIAYNSCTTSRSSRKLSV